MSFVKHFPPCKQLPEFTTSQPVHLPLSTHLHPVSNLRTFSDLSSQQLIILLIPMPPLQLARLLYFSGSAFFLLGGAREHRDNVSVLPICLNKEKLGWRSTNHTHAIASLTDPILLLPLTVASVSVSILEWRQFLKQLERLATSFDLGVLSRACRTFCHDLIVDHDGCYGGWQTTRDDGWDLAGHDAIVGAAKGEGEEVVEVGLGDRDQ